MNEPLTAQDFTVADLLAIRQMCIEDTKGEETWHGFTLANGREVDIDCFDEALITEFDHRGFRITAYPFPSYVDKSSSTSVSLGLIPYAEMKAY